MPFYLVRWPDLSASLVTADDEDHLLDVLDEIGNSEGCRWTEYDGPVFVHFHLPVEVSLDEKSKSGPIRPEEIKIGSVRKLAEREWPTIELPSADTTSAMMEAIREYAFPYLHKVFESSDDDTVNEKRVAEAVRQELMALISSSWRKEHAKKSPEPSARLAAEMDAPPRLVKWWREQAEARERKAQSPKSPPKKKPPKPKRR